MKIKVLITDDIEEYRKHFSTLLAKDNEINVVGTASSGSEAVLMAKHLKPDVILMDIQMETEQAGIVASKKILEYLPKTKIIVFTIHDDRENIVSAYDAGIVDYLLKTASPQEVIATIHDAVDSDEIKKNVSRIVKDEMLKLRKERDSFMYCVNLITRLSKSEIEILKMLCDGKKYREIAEERFVSESTVRVMINKISKKFSGDNIRDIVRQLNSNGIAKMIDKF